MLRQLCAKGLAQSVNVYAFLWQSAIVTEPHCH